MTSAPTTRVQGPVGVAGITSRCWASQRLGPCSRMSRTPSLSRPPWVRGRRQLLPSRRSSPGVAAGCRAHLAWVSGLGPAGFSSPASMLALIGRTHSCSKKDQPLSSVQRFHKIGLRDPIILCRCMLRQGVNGEVAHVLRTKLNVLVSSRVNVGGRCAQALENQELCQCACWAPTAGSLPMPARFGSIHTSRYIISRSLQIQSNTCQCMCNT